MDRAFVVALVAAINRHADVTLMTKFGEYAEAQYLTKPEMEASYIKDAERQVRLAEQET
jgi:hypothetical protein